MKKSHIIRKIFTSFLLTLLFFLSIAPIAYAASSQWISKGYTTEKVIAITIDDGSDAVVMLKFLTYSLSTMSKPLSF